VSDGAGGACRPRPSPDGKSLAMVRRIGLKTALVVRDLSSGRERTLFDGLDHDTMETWSIHGAFPGYCWLPDSSAIVVGAHGHLTRIDARPGDTWGAATTIPFHAKSTQRVHDALRFPHRIEDGPFEAKLVRCPALSADARTIWFQALGRIWRQELGGATAVALDTSSAGGFAYGPALSPDGTWLAFTTWENGVGGHVWRMPAGGGACMRLTAQPGHYANPAISRDGRRVAFVAGTGGTMRGEDLSSEPGLELRWVAADDSEKGESHEITATANRGPARRMPRVDFTTDGEHVLYFESANDRTAFVRVTLDGREKTTLFTNEDAEEIVASPDGKWIAFKEAHQIWVAPLPDAIGRPLVIGRKDAPVPVKKLTEIGGSWPIWSADGKSVGWLLGPRFALQEIAPLFVPEVKPEEAEKKEEKKPEKTREFIDAGVRPDAKVFELHAATRSDWPRTAMALTGARIVTMKGDEVIEDGTILVDATRIWKIGRREDVPIPFEMSVIDLKGKTVIPGLIDVHSHMHYDSLDVQPTQPWPYLANLAYGVTTAHDPSAATELVFAQSELVREGAMTGPRIFSTGYILYGAKNPNKAEVESLDDARHHLKRLAAVGAFSVKSYNQPRRNQRQWIVQAAREQQMLVVPEGGSLLAMNATMCLDGHTGIEHNLPVAPLYRDMIRLFAGSGTGITPTLIVSYGGLNGEYWWYQRDRVFEKQPLRSLTPPGWLEERSRRREHFAFEDDFQHVQVSKACTELLRAGGHIQLGAHGQLQGLGAHWELWMLGQGGMTPLEAIRCATYYGAWYLGLDQDLGSLEPGKLADFVVLDRNPLEDLTNSDSVSLVCANGRLYDAHTLKQLRPEEKPRPLLQWETK
jgi:imidazolonepropionase-like amidohydrolase